MADHDFRSLNDKDFESLCVDLLSEYFGVRFERFKAGKDKGVDGRHFSESRGEVVLQSKHWPKSTVSALLNYLAREEVKKVRALKPERYVLATSLELSRADKAALSKAFDPFLKPDDVLGLEDINDLLDRFPKVERNHYKLWIRSSGVLTSIINQGITGRSRFALEQMREKASRYVVTDAHLIASEMLERLGVVIVTGEPGVGKTTLAEQLCLSLVAEGYDFVRIHRDVHEGEAVFAQSQKQIFYFDDFLGRNYLDAVLRNEGSAITQFINRVAVDRSKRLVITSRSGILNQGRLLMDVLATRQAMKNDFELKIANLSILDKGKILYQHIWSSGLTPELVEEIYRDRRYRRIVEHRNFNPRLIDFITDSSNLDEIQPSGYWNFISHSLENPSEIWAHAFDMQLDDYGRLLVSLVVVNGRRLTEAGLREAYNRLLLHPERLHLSGRRDFDQALRILAGSLLNRNLSENGAVIDLFNPSVGDFVIGRLKQDVKLISDCLAALRSASSLLALGSMARAGLITGTQVYSALSATLSSALADAELKAAGNYLSCLFYVSSTRCEDLLVDRQVDFGAALGIAIADPSSRFASDFIDFVAWGVGAGLLEAKFATDALIDRVSELFDEDDFRSASKLLSTCEQAGGNCHEAWAVLTNALVVVAHGDIESFVDVTAVISEHGPGEHLAVKDAVAEELKKSFELLGVPFDPTDIDDAVQGFDFRSSVDNYFEQEREEDFERYVPVNRSNRTDFDELDDLFDRK